MSTNDEPCGVCHVNHHAPGAKPCPYALPSAASVNGICQEHGQKVRCSVCVALRTPSKIVSISTYGERLVALDEDGRLWSTIPLPTYRGGPVRNVRATIAGRDVDQKTFELGYKEGLEGYVMASAFQNEDYRSGYVNGVLERVLGHEGPPSWEPLFGLWTEAHKKAWKDRRFGGTTRPRPGPGTDGWP